MFIVHLKTTKLFLEVERDNRICGANVHVGTILLPYRKELNEPYFTKVATILPD